MTVYQGCAREAIDQRDDPTHDILDDSPPSPVHSYSQVDLPVICECVATQT